MPEDNVNQFQEAVQKHAQIQAMQSLDQSTSMLTTVAASNMQAMRKIADSIAKKIDEMTPEQYLELCRIQSGFTS